MAANQFVGREVRLGFSTLKKSDLENLKIFEKSDIIYLSKVREKSLERHIKNIIYLITQCRREATSRLRTLANGAGTKQGYLRILA